MVVKYRVPVGLPADGKKYPSHTCLNLSRVRVPPAGKKSSLYLYPSGQVPDGYRVPVPELPSLVSMRKIKLSRKRRKWAGTDWFPQNPSGRRNLYSTKTNHRVQNPKKMSTAPRALEPRPNRGVTQIENRHQKNLSRGTKESAKIDGNQRPKEEAPLSRTRTVRTENKQLRSGENLKGNMEGRNKM
jgi:hypothetical protein